MLELKANTTLQAMPHWIKSAGLNFVTLKTKVVLFMCHHQFSLLLLPEGRGDQALYYTAMKYFGCGLMES